MSAVKDTVVTLGDVQEQGRVGGWGRQRSALNDPKLCMHSRFQIEKNISQ